MYSTFISLFLYYLLWLRIAQRRLHVVLSKNDCIIVLANKVMPTMQCHKYFVLFDLLHQIDLNFPQLIKTIQVILL